MLSFDAPNWTATDPLHRDQQPSRRLHEPAQILFDVDPITGTALTDLAGLPYLVDGNVVIYFETEESRQLFCDMPTDHPLKLVDNPLEEGEAEG
ncbi:hypothetical protein [Thiobacter aerophilum]|uniref:Uncharacterized protein n=1 Tax=Thiobacter aerophilum TaxID=3121275 RepID=A0ABV0EJ77_9BURK